MVSRVDTATRHKREQRCYSFMHIYIYLLMLLFGQGERLFDWWANSHILLRKRRGEVLEKDPIPE